MNPLASCKHPVDYGMERGGWGRKHETCLDAEDRMYALCHFAYNAFGLVISSHSVEAQCNVTGFAEAPFGAAVSESTRFVQELNPEI